MAVKMPPTSVILKRLNLDANGQVRNYFTKRCADYMDEYVPMNKGRLREYKIDGSKIIYDVPYAQYQYYGISKSGKNLNYHTDKHRNASSYWDRKMVTNHMDDIVKDIQERFF